MRNLAIAALGAVLVCLPVLPASQAMAQSADLQGRWDMTSMNGDSLEGIEGGFHYTFQADGILVTETPFARYEGTWAEEGAGRIAMVLMSAMPDVAANTCDYEVAAETLRISNCGNGSPPAEFIRAP